MKNLLIVGAMLAMVLLPGCGIQSLIDKAKETKNEVSTIDTTKKAFESSVTEATVRAFMAAGAQVGTSVTAAAPRLSPEAFVSLAVKTGSTTINAMDGKLMGGSLSTKGNISWTLDTGSVATTLDQIVNLTADWSGIDVLIDGKSHKEKGNITLNGTYQLKAMGGNWETSGQVTETGWLILDGGAQSTFNIMLSLGGTSINYNGTLDGKPISGTFMKIPVPAIDLGVNSKYGTPDAQGLGCAYPANATCIDLSGSAYQNGGAASYGCDSPKVRVTACATSGRVGHCIDLQGTVSETVTNYYSGTAATWQAQCSGVWVPN